MLAEFIRFLRKAPKSVAPWAGYSCKTAGRLSVG
jgi:hypothetical protein